MIAKKLLVGASSRLVITAVNIGVAFVMTPFIIRNLGDESYGLWVLVSVISSFYGVMDFGLSVATQRAIAQALGKSDTRGANEAVITAFVMFCCVSLSVVAVTLVVMLFGPLIVDDEARITDFRITIGCLALSLVVLFPTYSINGIYTANYRYELTSLIHLGRVLLRSLLIFIAVSKGGGVVALAAITTLTDAMAGIAMVVGAHRLAPWLSWSRAYFRRDKLGELFDFGGAYLVASLCDRGRYALPSFAMNATVGLAGVTFFSVAQQIYDYIVLFLSNIFGVFQPLFVRQQSSSHHAANERDFIFVTQLALSVSVIMAIGALACAPDFIRTWLGARFEQALGPLFVLVVLAIFHTGLQINGQLLIAYSRHRALAVLSAVELAVSAALTWPLAMHFGMAGIAAAMMLPGVASRLVAQPVLLKKDLPFSLTRYYSAVLRACAALAIGSTAVLTLGKIVPGSGYARVITLGVIATAIAVPLVSLLCLEREVRARTFSALLEVIPRPLRAR